MRHGSGNTGNRRSRSRGGSRRGGNGGGNKSQVFDSNGPDVRIRGTAQQITEKYQNLAKDALSSGDYVMAESYFQHAEHYSRIVQTYAVKREQANQQKQNADGNVSDSSKATNNNNDEEDLSLPNSILGGDVDASSQKKIAETA